MAQERFHHDYANTSTTRYDNLRVELTREHATLLRNIADDTGTTVSYVIRCILNGVIDEEKVYHYLKKER